ncbi:MAG: hypothetical protein Kow0047_04890 [Anaerolineae bacterium]
MSVVQEWTAMQVTIVSVDGDLTISGWDENRIQAEADDQHSLDVEHAADGIRLRARDDLLLRVPRSATIVAQHVHGDAEIQQVEGTLKLGHVHGDLTLDAVGTVQIGHVGGDLTARQVHGAVQLGAAGGDVELDDVAGPAQIGSAGGDVNARRISGPLAIHAGGDVRVELASPPPQDWAITADGDISCTLPDGADVRLVVTSGAQEIEIVRQEGSEEHARGYHEVVIGGGTTRAALKAGGRVQVAIGVREGSPADAEEPHRAAASSLGPSAIDAEVTRYTRQITRQIEAQIEALTRKINAHLGRFGVVESQATPEQGRASAARPEPPEPPTAKTVEAESHIGDAPEAESDERVLILKMLQEKKISLEQADALLNALEA